MAGSNGIENAVVESGTDPAESLTQDELLRLMSIFNTCLMCETGEELYGAIRDFAAWMGYEFVLCAHMDATYDRARRVHMFNVTNPADWMAEYDARGFVEHDPVRAEMERRIAAGDQCGVIVWDCLDVAPTAIEAEILARRRAWGLEHGFSAFCNSARHEALFVISFASSSRIPDDRSIFLAGMVVPHVARCRKRLDLQVRVQSLSEREAAVARWLVDGKTNQEIAQKLAVSTSTVKYHVANILEKLGVRNRQNAINILIAERYLA